MAKTEAEKLAELEEAFASKLPGAKMGEVCTRFPPEPSGYLHIGHAKAAMVNNFYKTFFKGRIILRFDDTNPTKEKAEFEESILEDLKTMEIDMPSPTYTSDYFPQLQESMEEMIKMGKAYVDDTPAEKMRAERMEGVESRCRELTVEENLRRWNAMKEGTEEGQTMCVRAKINMKDKNKALRDPVMYRTNVNTPHHRTGSTFKVYPCYDFACPLVDSWSGVSHALRTNEYADRIPQYYWVQDTMGVRRTIIYEFSRLNLANTVLSKRKLQWLVDTGVVEGWDDPRFPTVRGLARRGLQMEALRQFIIEQGPSKNTNLMEWDKIWSKNQKVLDPSAPRYMAVGKDAVKLTITDCPEEGHKVVRPLHPKNTSLGEVEMVCTPVVLIEGEDANTIEEHEDVTLMRLGNVTIDSIRKDDEGKAVELVGHFHLDGDFKKTKKLHWIPTTGKNAKDIKDKDTDNDTDKATDKSVVDGMYEFVLREYDHIIIKKKPEEGDQMEDIVNRDSIFDTSCLGEPLLRDLKEGDIVQLERRGMIRVDKLTPEGKRIFIAIPTGKMKAMSKLSTKVDAANLVKGGAIAAN